MRRGRAPVSGGSQEGLAPEAWVTRRIITPTRARSRAANVAAVLITRCMPSWDDARQRTAGRERRMSHPDPEAARVGGAHCRHEVTVELAGPLIATFIASAGELWAGVPIGFALGLPPVLVAVASAAGATAASGLVIVVGAPVRGLIVPRLHPPKTGGRLERIWRRYGMPGLALSAPLLVGAPIGTAIGVALGAAPRPLLLWMTAGICLWSAALSAIAGFGIALVT